MNDKQYTQEGGENSENYQAANNITVNRSGLTFTEAKDLIMLVTQQNFIKFSEEATQTALARMEKLVTDYLNGINAKNPSLVDAVKDPGMQMALVAAQKEYVRTGDENIAELLTNVLIERTTQSQRTILQITLDECIVVIGKLTNTHIDTILLCFIITQMSLGVRNVDDLREKFNSHLVALLSTASKGYSAYEHIAACGCGNTIMGNSPIMDYFIENYQGFFSKGNTVEEIEAKIIKFPNMSILLQKGFIGSCFRNPKKIQFLFANKRHLRRVISEFNLDMALQTEVESIFTESTISKDEAQQYLLNLIPGMRLLFDMWENTSLQNLSLNNIGKAIAIIAYKVKFKTELPFNLWITD